MKLYSGFSRGISSHHRVSHIINIHHRHQHHPAEELWESLFSDPSQWWDNRLNKTRHGQPDFTHKTSRQPLWLNNKQKPLWVEPSLRQLDSAERIKFASIGRQIQSLCEEGNLESSFNHFCNIESDGVFPSEYVYLSLLKLCNIYKRSYYVAILHAHLARHGLELTSFVGEYLVVTLAKCGNLDDAFILFNRLPHRTVFSWTAMISSFTDHKKGQEALKMYADMVKQDVKLDKFTFATLAKTCASTSDLEQGRKIHCDARRSGFATDVFVGSALIGMYSKCGSIEEAELAFIEISCRNIVSWNAMLSAYVEHGLVMKAFQLFRQMQAECIYCDARTFVISLQACCILARNEDSGTLDIQSFSRVIIALEIGRGLHADLKKKDPTFDIYMNNVLVSMYAKCGSIVEAENVFCGMDEYRNSISWNELVLAYVEQGCIVKALQLYKVMQQGYTTPDHWSFVMFLQACCLLEDKDRDQLMDESHIRLTSLLIGRALHDDAKRMHLACHLFVGNSLVKMYGKCGSTIEAENAFEQLTHRDVVSWNAMLSAYVEKSGQQEKAFTLFEKMLEAGPWPDDITLVYMLRACSGTSGSSRLCRLIHVIVLCIGCDDKRPLLANTLLHAYGCCSSMPDAQAVFDRLTKKDVTSWNSLIAGYAQDGNLNACLENFERMQGASGIEPDGITFVSMFFAFSHSGFVDKGMEFFASISKYGIPLEIKHFGGIMDIFARAGDFRSLESMLLKMPMQPDATLWSSLLGACQTHNNRSLAEYVFNHAVNHDANEVPAYVLMSNIYSREEVKLEL